MATFIPLTPMPGAARAAQDSDTFLRTAALGPAHEGAVADTRGRALSDLRISVTDRCNFRCVYCMPKDVFGRDYPFLPHAELLTFEEIARVAKVFVGLGVRKIRLTGGEPLLRRNLEKLVEMLARLPDVDLTLTTNGALLAKKAKSLRDAGLSRVTVSLDSLDDATFRAMNDVDFPVASVLAGIDAAATAGLAPLKINMVVKKGLNEDSIVPMARHFKGTGHIVRYIEYMDVGATNGWRMDDVVPAAQVVAMIGAELPLIPADPNYEGEVAQRWRYQDGSGEIGVIASVTQAFCRDCTRARLSTEGKLYTCLFATHGSDLRNLLRGGFSDAQLANAIAAVWSRRADRYSELRTANTPRLPKVEMSYIGGWVNAPNTPYRPLLTDAARPSTFEVRAVDENGATRDVSVAGEHPLTLYVDKQELLTLMTLGAAPEALAIGYLRNQRLVASIDDIVAVQVDWETNSCAVKTRSGLSDLEAKTAKRTKTSGCGQGTMFGDLMDEIDDVRLPPGATLSQATLYDLLDRVRLHETIYKQAGAVHGCALATNGGHSADIIMFVEDVGRHNAVDAIAGRMWLDRLDGADKIFYTTGRLTSEMVIKAAQMGIPFLVSRSGLTQMGYEIAEKVGITMIGRATNRHYLLFTGAQRFAVA